MVSRGEWPPMAPPARRGTGGGNDGREVSAPYGPAARRDEGNHKGCPY